MHENDTPTPATGNTASTGEQINQPRRPRMQARAIPLPSGLGAALAEALLGRLGAQGGDDWRPVPATPEQARYLIDGAEYKPALGDIVMLREKYDETLTMPLPGERCVVTQVLRDGLHDTDELAGTKGATHRNIALAFAAPCDGDECPPGTVHVREWLFDSRNFRKVGHVDTPAPDLGA